MRLIFFPGPPRLGRVCPWTAGGVAGGRSVRWFSLGSWLQQGTEFIQPWLKTFICTSCDAGGSASRLPSRDSDFWVECFGDEGEAQGFIVGELLLYSLTLPLTICLLLEEKKKREQTARGAKTEGE